MGLRVRAIPGHRARFRPRAAGPRLQPKPKTIVMLPRTTWLRCAFAGRVYPAQLVTGFLLVLAAATAGPVLAVDGHVDMRLTHQEGRSGEQAVRSNDRWELVGLEERVPLSRNALFQLQYTAQREVLSGAAAGTRVDNSIFVQNPGANLSWQSTTVRANLFARANRSDQELTGTPLIRDESLEYGLWSALRLRQANFDLSLRDATSWRETTDQERKNRERVATGNLRWALNRHDVLHLRVTRTDLNAMTAGYRTSFATDQIQYDGERSFAGARGRLDWSLLHSRFTQEQVTSTGQGDRYARPVSAGWWIDDTPQMLDPLENQPELVPALHDNNRTTPTTINLGDNAPLGRDYGGDYRNIYVDFGEPQAMDELFLRVDRRLTFIADIMQWDVYFCDEPEGRDWGTAMPAGSWSVRYVELETGQQGWVFRFGETVSHRRVKLVNRKLAATMGDLFVTELEILVDDGDQPAAASLHQDRSMAQGALEYRFHPRLLFRYNTLFDRHSLRNADGRQDRLDQSAAINWRSGDWVASGQALWSDEQSPSGLDTRSDSQSLSLARQGRGRLTSRLSWSRTADDNYEARFNTESVGADMTWRAAPALSFSQKLSRGWRSSDSGMSDSDSWVATTEIRSRPRPGLRIDLSRANRWVSRDVGPGFTAYNTTQVDANWELTPLLFWWGQYMSQERDERDWVLRNSVSWSPLQGGSLKLSFQATDTQDSRLDLLRRGGGAALEWRARPRLFLSASAEKSYERLAGARDWPFSAQVRGYWTF